MGRYRRTASDVPAAAGGGWCGRGGRSPRRCGAGLTWLGQRVCTSGGRTRPGFRRTPATPARYRARFAIGAEEWKGPAVRRGRRKAGILIVVAGARRRVVVRGASGSGRSPTRSGLRHQLLQLHAQQVVTVNCPDRLSTYGAAAEVILDSSGARRRTELGRYSTDVVRGGLRADEQARGDRDIYESRYAVSVNGPPHGGPVGPDTGTSEVLQPYRHSGQPNAAACRATPYVSR
jgi:hypothetical protein